VFIPALKILKYKFTKFEGSNLFFRLKFIIRYKNYDFLL